MTNKLKVQIDLTKDMELEDVPFMLIARLAAKMGAYVDMSGGRLRVVAEKPGDQPKVTSIYDLQV